MPAPKRGRLLPAELVGEVLDSSPVPLVTRLWRRYRAAWHDSVSAPGVCGGTQRDRSGRRAGFRWGRLMENSSAMSVGSGPRPAALRRQRAS